MFVKNVGIVINRFIRQKRELMIKLEAILMGREKVAEQHKLIAIEVKNKKVIFITISSSCHH